jgi:hypothetical protein
MPLLDSLMIGRTKEGPSSLATLWLDAEGLALEFVPIDFTRHLVSEITTFAASFF